MVDDEETFKCRQQGCVINCKYGKQSISDIEIKSWWLPKREVCCPCIVWSELSNCIRRVTANISLSGLALMDHSTTLCFTTVGLSLAVLDTVIIITTFHNKHQSYVFAVLADRLELQVRCFSCKLSLSLSSAEQIVEIKLIFFLVLSLESCDVAVSVSQTGILFFLGRRWQGRIVWWDCESSEWESQNPSVSISCVHHSRCNKEYWRARGPVGHRKNVDFYMPIPMPTIFESFNI